LFIVSCIGSQKQKDERRQAEATTEAAWVERSLSGDAPTGAR
jgi:hypothetical protein